MQETSETWVWSLLGQKDPLEEGMATHSSILTWKIPWTGGLQSLVSQRIRHDWSNLAFAHACIWLTWISALPIPPPGVIGSQGPGVLWSAVQTGPSEWAPWAAVSRQSSPSLPRQRLRSPQFTHPLLAVVFESELACNLLGTFHPLVPLAVQAWLHLREELNRGFQCVFQGFRGEWWARRSPGKDDTVIRQAGWI